MARLDTPIVLIDESIVDYGFRVLMSGYQGEQFSRNPVLLMQHKRVDDGYQALTENAVLPLGKWCDIQVRDGHLLAYPEFDDDDAFAMRVENKVKKGYLNAASIWIDPIEVSDDEYLKLPGQYGPTITKWGVREASIVDIPNCRNALAIRTSAGKKIALAGAGSLDQPEVIDYLNSLLPTNINPDMEKKLLCAKLGLSEDASDKQINEKLTATLAAAENGTTLSTENKNLKDELVRLKTEQETTKIANLVDGAITDKKLAAGDRETYVALATAAFDTTKKLIDGMKPYESVETRLAGTGETNGEELAGLMKLSGVELYRQEKLERLKQIAPLEQFKLKYKEAFGAEYKS